MIPIGDSVAHRRPPYVTVAIIVAAVLVFAYELTLRGRALDLFVARWGVVPGEVLAALAGDPRVPRTVLLTLVTSQFVHAGFVHLGGNMLFLWVFGRAVEDRFGHLLYLAVYLLVGALAGLAQAVVVGPRETVPMIGASGAIAGVLGAYFVSYPRAWVTILAPILFFFWAFDLPAVLVLAFWFVSQFFNGLAAITAASQASTGVAFLAHVSGFVLGALSAPLLPRAGAPGGTRTPAPAVRRADAPGPARLISSVADLLALLLAARLVLRLLDAGAPRSPLAGLAAPIFGVTTPLVEPIADLVPALRVDGLVVETYTLLAIVVVYVIAGLLGQVLARR